MKHPRLEEIDHTLIQAIYGHRSYTLLFDLYDFCHRNGQAARRMRDLHFPRYHFDNQAEFVKFVGAPRSLLKLVPLSVDVPVLLTYRRWFREWSLGASAFSRIGW